MADRLILAPPDVLRQMVDDLRHVAEVPLETLRRVSQQLLQQDGFFQDAELGALLTESIEGEPRQSAVFNVLQNVRPDALEQVLETVETWRTANERNRARFPDALYDQLRERLQILIQRFPALDRMRKAERLRTALGKELKGAVFICDARPVYNDSREQIEGMIPVTTLKVVYELQDHSTEEIEFVLSTEQLSNLLEQARKAQHKLTVLRDRITEWLPDGYVEVEE